MASNLTKRDIVLEIYEKTNFPQKEVKETVQMTLDVIAKAIGEGRNVELRNFGVFRFSSGNPVWAAIPINLKKML